MKNEDFFKRDEKTANVCLSCMAPNYESDDVCQNCGAPLREPSSLDPIQTIRNEGALFQKTVSGRPKLIVLIGAWIFFVSWIITTIAVEINIISSWDGLFSLVLFWCGVALFLFAVYVLFNVTKNYINARESYQADANKHQLSAENRQRAKEKRRARMKGENN
jgi:hypothetical protein